MMSTKVSEHNFKRTLETCIDYGKLALVENIGEEIDVHIESLVRREITKYGNQKMIKYCRKPIKYEPNFNLIILTNLTKPHYDPNITNHLTLVNFYMTVEGLSENLLAMIVANERPDLEKSFSENSAASFDNIKLLKETETRIIDNLSSNVDKILSNEKLIEILKESKMCAETVAEKLKRIGNTN